MNRMALEILAGLKGQNPAIDAAIVAIETLGTPHKIHLKRGSAKTLTLDAGTPGVVSIRSQAGANILHDGDLTMHEVEALHAFLGVVLAANNPTPEPPETP